MWLAGTAAIGACAWWALPPLPAPAALSVTLQPMEASAGVEVGVVPIDVSLFSARLWNAPPGLDVEEPGTADDGVDQRTVRFQLIGITRDRGRLYAVLYDPEADRLLTVGNGDRVRRHTVTAISESEVELSDGRATRRLVLREGQS